MNTVAPKQKEDGKLFQLRQLQSYAKGGSRGKQFALAGLKQQLPPQPRLSKPVQLMPNTPLNDSFHRQRQDKEMRDSVEDDEPDWMKVKKSPSPKRKLVLDPVDFQVNKRREVERPGEVETSGEVVKSGEVERRSPLVNGLKNIGNSCYMNAVLQAVSSLASFKADMQQPRLVTAKMPENGVYRALQYVLREMEVSERNKAVSPATLKSSIMKNSVRFQGMFQQDAHEFLCDLLDQVQNEVYLYHDKHRLKLETPKLRLSETDCPTTRNFSCIVRHDLECNSCGHSSTVEELFRHFSLDIPQCVSREEDIGPIQKPPNILELLQHFFKEEVYEKTCEECGFSNCTVRRVIRRLPRILVLHLKRFCINETVHQYKKNTGQVCIQGTLDLEFCCSGSTKRPLPLQLEGSKGNGLDVRTSVPPLPHASTPLSDISNLPRTNLASGRFQEAAHKAPSTSEDPFEFEPLEENEDLERAVQESMDDVTKLNFLETDQLSPRVEDEDLKRAIEMSLQEFSGNASPILEDANRITPAGSSPNAQDTSREVPAVIEVDDSSSNDDSPQMVSGSGRYLLQGIVSHLGPMVSSGHFIADILTSSREQWFRYDDSFVHPVSESNVFSPKKETEAYLLFYVHQDLIPQPVTPEAKEVPVDRPSSIKQYVRRNRFL